MSKVTFVFDKQKDLWNVWSTCNFKSSWADFKSNIHPKMLEIAENKEFNECKEALAKHCERIHNSPLIEAFVKSLNQSWGEIDKEFIERIERIMKKPFDYEKVTCYVTTMMRCPYNADNLDDSWFMVSFFNSLPSALKTVGHEMMHLQFHRYYWDECERIIGKEKTADLKESLTVLLNIEFKDLWFVRDEGYDKHKKLREFISKRWKEIPDFDTLLKSSIDFLKLNN